MVSVSIVGVVQITIIKAAGRWLGVSMEPFNSHKPWIMTVEWLHAVSYAKVPTL